MAKMGFTGGEEEKKPGTGTGAGTGTGTGTGGNSGSGNKGDAGAGSSSQTSDRYKNYEEMKAKFEEHYKNQEREKMRENTRDPLNPEAPQTETPTNEQKAETSLAELRNQYSQMLQDRYNYNAEKLREEKDAALRENWILQQQAQAALPEQLAAAGLNGGAAETSLADLRALYQGQHNDIQSDYMNSLADLGQQHLAEQAQSENGYNEKWLEYLLDLARTEAAAKLNK